MKRWISGIVLLISVSCAHDLVKFRQDGPRTLLFPPGVYFHDVKIAAPDGEARSMQGVLKIEPKKIQMVGLSPFQTTLFRLVDEPPSKPELKIFESRMEKLREPILQFYSTLRPLLRLKLTSPHDRPESLPLSSYQVEISQYDGNGIPRALNLSREKVHITVRVSGYEVGVESSK